MPKHDDFETISAAETHTVVGGETRPPSPPPEQRTDDKKPLVVTGGDPTMGLLDCFAKKLGVKVPSIKGVDFKPAGQLSCETHEKLGKVLKPLAD